MQKAESYFVCGIGITNCKYSVFCFRCGGRAFHVGKACLRGTVHFRGVIGAMNIDDNGRCTTCIKGCSIAHRRREGQRDAFAFAQRIGSPGSVTMTIVGKGKGVVAVRTHNQLAEVICCTIGRGCCAVGRSIPRMRSIIVGDGYIDG